MNHKTQDEPVLEDSKKLKSIYKDSEGKFDFKKYRELNKDKINEQMLKYRTANKDKINQKSKIYYEQKKDEINERRREKYAAKNSLYSV